MENNPAREHREIRKAYWERNQLVAFISKLFPSYLVTHSKGEYKSKGWSYFVLIQTPSGQLSFHIHKDELDEFSHCLRISDTDVIEWDGHSTEEKFARLAKLNKVMITNWRAEPSSRNRQ